MPEIAPGPMGCVTPMVPVRDMSGARLPLDVIRAYVMLAVDHARRNRSVRYRVQQDGWGYKADQIAPLFDHCPMNVSLPYRFIY